MTDVILATLPIFLLIFVLMVISNVIQLMGDKKRLDARNK